MQLYEKIQRDNVKKYGTRVNDYIPIIINQYSDRTHFIYELLQNAEDAGATHIKFHLHGSNLEIFHNGRPFNEKDIIGVCGIADGTKGDGTRIGHFGIGFKAVYGYTATPEIYSGEYCFQIRDYLNPFEVTSKPGLSYDETCMIIPFDKPAVSKDIAFKEIREALTKKITAESVIILDSIRDIEIKIDGFEDVITINKEKGAVNGSENVYELSLLTTYENQRTHVAHETENTYIFFTDAEKEATSIIFKVDGKELQEVKNSKIYAFFPTAREAHQNFYIHAPFDTTPARDNFKEGEDFGRHNIMLINNLGRLITYAFLWLRDNEYLTLSGLSKVFPIYEYDADDILYSIYQNSIDIIKSGEKILPTNKDGVYKSIDEICVPENMGIVGSFNDTDLQRLLGNHKLYWLSKEISTNAYSNFKEFLDKNFDFKTLEWRHLVLKMDAPFLQEKDIHWTERLMGSIESFCIKRGVQQSHYMDVSAIPLVRTTDGKQICAKKDGKLQVYLNNPNVADYKIADDFRKNEIIRSFFERALGIPEYDLERETIDKILPKYVGKKVNFKTEDHIRENIEDLKAIKDAIYMNPRILEQIQDKYIVTDGSEWFRPSELYIQSNDTRTGYDLIRGIVNLHFLANSYFDDTVLNIRLDEDFFKKIGCSLGIREEHVTKEEYYKIYDRYCGRDAALELKTRVLNKAYLSKKFDWAFNFVGFPDVFVNMSPEKSKKIAKFLNGNAVKFDIQGDLTGADDQNFSGKNVDSMVAYSMLGMQLCYEKWIYIKGNPQPQRPIDVDRDDLIDGYEPAKRIIAAIPFKEVKNALYEYLEEQFGDKADVDLIRRLMSDKDGLLKLAKQKAKSEAKLAAQQEKKGSLKDRLERGDKSQVGGAEERIEEFEVAAISEKALARREKKLEEELVNSLQNHTAAARGAYFTRQQSSEGEKQFLKLQYDGVCQICHKRIVKWNGDSYFEAINVIKPSSLYDELVNSLDTGWNSLSLCPNCAAEYNYCSKKISTIYDQVMAAEIIPDDDEPIDITIEMPEGKQRLIKYSPRHLLALKKAFELFAKE